MQGDFTIEYSNDVLGIYYVLLVKYPQTSAQLGAYVERGWIVGDFALAGVDPYERESQEK